MGDLPFPGLSLKEIMNNNEACNIVYDELNWIRITEEGKDLIKRMMNKNPELRINIKEILEHPWFTMELITINNLSSAQNNINKYCNENMFNIERIKPEFGFSKYNRFLHSLPLSYVNNYSGTFTKLKVYISQIIDYK